MDGVLVDTKKIWSSIDKEFLKRKGIIYKDEYKLQVKGKDQREVVKLYKNIFKLKGKLNSLIKERNKIAYIQYKNKSRLTSSTCQTIKNLFRSGFKLVLASNAPMKLINIILQKFHLKKYFSLKISAQSFKRGKPAPDIYLAVAKQLRISPRNCLVIEDTFNGIKAAKRAGMYCIGILDTKYTKKEDLLKADLLVKSLKEITPEMIKRF